MDDSIEVKVQVVNGGHEDMSVEGLVDARVPLADPAEELGYTHCPTLTLSLTHSLVSHSLWC